MPRTKKSSAPIHCRLTPENASQVRATAEKERNSFNAVANRLIEKGILAEKPVVSVR